MSSYPHHHAHPHHLEYEYEQQQQQQQQQQHKLIRGSDAQEQLRLLFEQENRTYHGLLAQRFALDASVKRSQATLETLRKAVQDNEASHMSETLETIMRHKYSGQYAVHVDSMRIPELRPLVSSGSGSGSALLSLDTPRANPLFITIPERIGEKP